MAVRSGDLRWRVIIQRRADTDEGWGAPGQDAYGQPVGVWTSYATRWAAVEPLSARERFTGAAELSEVSHRVRLRKIHGVRPSWRLLWRTGEITELEEDMPAGPAAGDTTILAGAGPVEFPADAHYLIQIEDEILRVTSGFGTSTWSVRRGMYGTSQPAHVAGTKVYLLAVLEIESVTQPALDETHLLCRQPGTSFGAGE